MHTSPRPKYGHRARARGLALITVMWLLALIAVLATTTLQIARSRARMSARAVRTISTQVIADSALRLILLQLAQSAGEPRELGFDARWRITLFDRDVEIRVEREAGRVDLNVADASLIAAVFIASGTEAVTARSFASRIIDWRDTNDQAEPGGAERDDYRRAQMGYGPRNKPFESIGELRQVLGLAELSPKVLDAFTVYSSSIDPELAHPLVRIALQSLSTSQSLAPRHAPPQASGTQVLAHQVARIHACVTQGDITSCRVVIARLMLDHHRPLPIYAWYSE